MNEDSSKILKANLRYLGNTFFYLGLAFLVLAVIVESIAFANRAAASSAVLSASFTACLVLTPLFFGMWISVATIGRRIKLLERLEEQKKAKALASMK